MNLLASSGFQSFINGIFANWQMLLFVVLSVLLLLTIAFRKFKLVPVALSLLAAAIFGVLIIDLIVVAQKWDLEQLVDFLVRWVPTVLFSATVLIATLTGVRRGLRKSLILLAHEVGAAAICIIVYVVLINLPQTDAFLLNVADLIMGGKGALAAKLNVSAPCEGLKDVFVEWLPTVIKGDFNIMLSESKAYIYTLADLIERVALALMLFIVYLVIDLILYIIYVCCYSERKYREKITKKYVQNKVDRRYSRHWVGGGVVGLVRGTAIAILSLSFLGTALYVVAGRGDGKLKDFDFENERYNTYYSVYRSIEGYGTYGIFKVLNAISSTEDVPYYLFAADLIFSGELNDEEFGVSDNVVFREELNAYTGFARDTMALLMKYGGEELKPLINGTATSQAFDKVLSVMSDDMFRAEFNDLISEFDSQTYIINFAMSFVNSAVANIDKMSFAGSVSKENRELLKILFEKGYLSDTIPDEAALKESLGGEASPLTLPYINISKLVDKNDVQIIFNVALDILSNKPANVNQTLNLVGDLLPEIKKVSLLNENREAELDPVLGRLYCYAANRFLTEEGSQGVTFLSVYKEKIEWISEINSLIEVADSSLALYNNIYDAESKPMDMVLSIFDKDSAEYKENCGYYDTISKNVYSSRILGKVLAESKTYNLLNKGLSGLFSGIYIPDDIVYESTFDESGKLVSAGEMFNLLNGVGTLGKNSDLLSVISGFDADRDMQKFLNSLAETVAFKDEYGNTLSHYIVESSLLRSVISAAIINYGADYMYVPMVARESNAQGEKLNYITKGELKVLMESLPELTEFLAPILSDKESDMTEAIAQFIKKETFNKLVSGSTVFEGTVAKLLTESLDGNQAVILPAALKADLEGWVTVNGGKGELRNMLGALEEIGLDAAELVKGEFDTKKIIDNVLAIDSEGLKNSLKSKVLHYTVSDYLTGDGLDYGTFELIVPEAALQLLQNDSVEGLVKESELQTLIVAVKDFKLSDETNISSVFVSLVKNKRLLDESFILSSSVVYSIVNSAETADILKLPQKFVEAAQFENLKKYNSSNPWKREIMPLVNALDEILGVSTAENFEFNEEQLQEKLSSILRDLNSNSVVNANVTRLKVCCASEVVSNNITVRLDEILLDKIDNNLLYGAKIDGYYSEKELESLCNALNIFDIDVMNIDGDALTQKVKDNVLNLNEIAEGYMNKTNLNLVYPSVIFSGILSKELDGVLLEAEDEDGNPSPLLSESVLAAIKGGTVYSEEEICNLINSVKAFGINSFDEIKTLDFDDIKTKTDKIDEICKSLVMRGVFTKQIAANSELDVDHALAYEDGVKILKVNEIKSLVNIINEVGVENVEDMYFDDVKLIQIKRDLFEEDGAVKSYLILSAVSKVLKTNANLYVNRKLIDSYGCVREDEVFALINAFLALEDDENISIGEWSVKGGNFKYPTFEQRERAFLSEIARAKITEQIIKNNERIGENYVSENNVSEFTDYRTGSMQILISYAELHALFNALDICNRGGNFTIPAITLSALRDYQQQGEAAGQDYVELLFASDAIRYKICDCIIDSFHIGEEHTTQERVYNLSTGASGELKRVVTLQQIKDALKI